MCARVTLHTWKYPHAMLTRNAPYCIVCFLSGAAVVAAAAIRGWCLLLSTLPSHRLTAPFVEAALGSLAGQLYSEAVDVRESAGEAIVLLYDAAGLAELEGDSGASATPL